jgi:hypothetical protein
MIRWEIPLKKTLLTCLVFAALSVSAAYAQQFDAAFGVGTLTAPSASVASGGNLPVTMGGGTYLNFSADFLFIKHFGINGEATWRASQNLYGGFQPYRPILYDFNAIYAPENHRIGGEFTAGIGAESLRFYQPFFNCGFTGCTNYTSSNHFLGHFGAAVRIYAVGNFFIRPEAHLYLINNNFEFSSGRATRFGVSLGYSFKPGF